VERLNSLIDLAGLSARRWFPGFRNRRPKNAVTLVPGHFGTASKHATADIRRTADWQGAIEQILQHQQHQAEFRHIGIAQLQTQLCFSFYRSFFVEQRGIHHPAGEAIDRDAGLSLRSAPCERYLGNPQS
jgi:hypothetical protein